MSKKSIMSLLTAFLAIMIVSFTTTTAFATSSNNPYGFTYEDSSNGKTIYRYYSYDATSKNYKITREFYSRGNFMYTGKGVLICNTSYASGARYNGFDTSGNFYIVGSNGSLTVSNTNNKTSVIIESGAIKLNYNSVDLAISVTTTSGTKSLSTLKDIPETDDDDIITPSKPVAKNRVEIYTNSADEMVYSAYKNGSLKTKVIVSGKKVLNQTDGVRLSDLLDGAKFLGFDSNYNVYLTEGSTLYRFKQSNWYSAEKLSLSGTFKSFTRDDNGFIAKVVTSKGNYTIKQLTTSSKWKAKKTYCVKKSNYVTLYSKGSSKSNTLLLNSNKLYLNGKRIAKNVSKFGFTKSKKIIYIKNGTAYTAKLSTPTKITKLCSKAKKLTTNSLGLVTKVTLTKGSKKVS